MKFLKIKDIKNSSVYITPNFPVLQTKRYKFSFLRVLGAISLYTLFISIIVLAVVLFTPARNVVFFFENDRLNEQIVKVKELEGKVYFLSNELQKLASTNERLKYAMILASTDSLDSSSAIYDSLRKENSPLKKSGGNLLGVFLDFIKLFQSENSEGIFISPVSGIIIKKYEPDRGHLGIDYGVKKGTSIHAVQSGVVIFSGFTPEYGYSLIIQHEEDFISVYRHCESILVKERETVKQGELVALSGNSGYKTTGPHLHFELWKSGKTVNPENFIINN